jgi:hypothetical protein
MDSSIRKSNMHCGVRTVSHGVFVRVVYEYDNVSKPVINCAFVWK